MISLFNKGLDEEDHKRRELYLDRLKEIVTTAEHESTRDAGSTETPAVFRASSASQPNPSAPAAVQTHADAIISPIHPTDPSRTSQFQELADEISRDLASAFAAAAKKLHRIATASHQRLEDGLATISAASERIHNLGTDVAILRQQTDTLLQSEHSLSVKLAAVDARLRDYDESWQHTSDKLQALEKRLDNQAKAIRSLHAVLQECTAQLEELRNTLQKLAQHSVQPSTEIKLPENL